MTIVPRALTAALVGLLLLVTPSVATASVLPTDPDRAAGPLGGALLGGTGTVVGLGAPPAPPAAVAAGWLVADLDTGEVLGAKNAHGQFAPASTLKILTAIALPPLLQPDQKLVPTFDDVAVEGSRVGLVERVGYPVDELFQALMMVSGNDVAMTLARGAGGPAAIEAMNAEARRLQALDTLAVNPHGLDAPGQVSSPYDLALLARAGMASPDFRRWVSARRGSVSGPGGQRIATYNHNKLLASYKGALGIKNGFTSRARASFVGAATRNGRTLVVTTMRTQPRVHVEAAALLDWGFAAAAAGAQPIGVLVPPVDDAPVESAPEAENAVVTESIGTAGTEDGGPGPATVGAVALLGAILLVRRRRRLVLARSAARRAARAAGTPAGPSRARPARSRSAAGPATTGRTPSPRRTTVPRQASGPVRNPGPVAGLDRQSTRAAAPLPGRQPLRRP